MQPYSMCIFNYVKIKIMISSIFPYPKVDHKCLVRQNFKSEGN